MIYNDNSLEPSDTFLNAGAAIRVVVTWNSVLTNKALATNKLLNMNHIKSPSQYRRCMTIDNR